MILNLQDFVIDKGLETKTINRWREMFPNYTPLDREYGRHHTYGAGEIPGTSGFFRLETGSHRPFVSPLESTLNFGMNLVKRGRNGDDNSDSAELRQNECADLLDHNRG